MIIEELDHFNAVVFAVCVCVYVCVCACVLIIRVSDLASEKNLATSIHCLRVKTWDQGKD